MGISVYQACFEGLQQLLVDGMHNTFHLCPGSLLLEIVVQNIIYFFHRDDSTDFRTIVARQQVKPEQGPTQSMLVKHIVHPHLFQKPGFIFL